MDFSPTQHQAIIENISANILLAESHVAKVQERGRSLANSSSMVPGLGDLIMECVHGFVEAASWLLREVKELLAGALAPVFLWENVYQWESVRGIASGVAGEVTVGVLGSTGDWKGAAATAYTQAIIPQSTAAARLATVSDKTAITLGICAAAGLTFYGALAVTLTEEVDLTEAAAEASATGVGAAAAIVAETAGTIWNIQNIVKVSAALGALLASQAAALATLHGDAIDTSAYPGGHWPKSANL